MTDITRAKLEHLNELVAELDDVAVKNAFMGTVLKSAKVGISIHIHTTDDAGRFDIAKQDQFAIITLIQRSLQQRFEEIQQKLALLGYSDDPEPEPGSDEAIQSGSKS